MGTQELASGALGNVWSWCTGFFAYGLVFGMDTLLRQILFLWFFLFLHSIKPSIWGQKLSPCWNDSSNCIICSDDCINSCYTILHIYRA